MDLVDLAGDALRHPRNGCILITACGHDDLIGCENADIRGDFKGLGVIPSEPGDRYSFVNRWLEGMRVRFNVSNNLVLDHKSVWIRSGIGMAGQLALPVRRYQTKAVPSLRSPGFCQSVLFEDEVVNSPLFKQVTGGEACLSATNH